MIEEAKQRSIRMATRKRIAVHEAVRTYILCKCPSLDNFNEEEGMSPKFKHSLSQFARPGVSQDSQRNYTTHSPKHSKHPRQLLQYSRFTPYQFSKMVTYCVQREVNIGTEGEVIPEEELIELVQSCDLLENSPVYRKMRQYQNIGKLETVQEEDDQEERPPSRGTSHKLETKAHQTQDNIGSTMFKQLPSLKKTTAGSATPLKHTMTNQIMPLKLPGAERKKWHRRDQDNQEMAHWQQKRLNILSVAKLLSTSESQRMHEQYFNLQRIESNEEPPQILENKVDQSSQSQSIGSMHQQISIGEVLKEQKRKYQKVKGDGTVDGIKFFPVETLDSKFNDPQFTAESDEEGSSYYDYSHLSQIRQGRLTDTSRYKKSATAKDQNLTGRKWGSSRRKLKRILKQKTFSPQYRRSPEVKDLRSKIKYEHSKTIVMGKKIDEMETNCAGLIEKVKDLLESPNEEGRRSSQ